MRLQVAEKQLREFGAGRVAIALGGTANRWYLILLLIYHTVFLQHDVAEGLGLVDGRGARVRLGCDHRRAGAISLGGDAAELYGCR